MKAIIVLGGYGAFGRRIVGGLLGLPIELVVAGRRVEAAQALVDTLAPGVTRVSAAAMDTRDPRLVQRLQELRPWLVIDTCGPFQGRDYAVARACIEAGSHYVDLADGRDSVSGIGALDEQARGHGVAVISGASSVPGLSSAVVDTLAQRLSRVDRIEIGIAPGNRGRPGAATVRAVLGYLGQPIRRLRGGEWVEVRGWMDGCTERFPDPVGHRRLSNCDVPDLALFGSRYGAQSVQFRAGQELALIHRGMTAMARLSRLGLVRDWSRHASGLQRVADRLRRFGTDTGGMVVRVHGLDQAGRPRRLQWMLVATDDYGPEIPSLPARILARRWIDQPPEPGARPCLGEFPLTDFATAADPRFVRTTIEELAAPLVVYDGVCGLCNGLVDRLLRLDREGVLYFTHCQSELGAAHMVAAGLEPDDMSSFVLVDDAGTQTRSDAALRVIGHLGGAARWLLVLRWVPRPVRDAVYDFVARHRYRWFGRGARCRVPSPQERRRFVGV